MSRALIRLQQQAAQLGVPVEVIEAPGHCIITVAGKTFRKPRAALRAVKAIAREVEKLKERR